MKKTFYIILVFLAIFILMFLIEQIVILTSHNETLMFFSFSLLMAIIGFLLARFGPEYHEFYGDVSSYGIFLMWPSIVVLAIFIFVFIIKFLLDLF